MRKIDEIEQPASCLNKARAEEPLFVLRAKDPLAPAVVRTWANNAEATGAHEPEKIAEARALADAMDEYRKRVHSDVPPHDQTEREPQGESGKAGE